VKIDPRNYPDFFVIGAAKCGTTTLYGLLRQHPDIYLPSQKETHFFFWNGKTPNYTDPGATRLREVAITDREVYERLYHGKAGLKGEICPSYFMGDQTAEEIAKIRPDAKIIAILRDPVERTFSAYRHMKSRGSEPEDFDGALASEADHIAQNWQPVSHYTRGSLYYPRLKLYYDRFSPEQIMVVEFERLKEDPKAVSAEVLAFLGLPPLPEEAGMAQTNKTVVVRNGLLRKLLVERPPWVRRLRKILPQGSRARIKEALLSRVTSEEEKMSEESRARLKALFAEDAQMTRELTGQRFENWSV
jgi:hypothetical protein